MTFMLGIIAFLFWILLLYYAVLTAAGILFRVSGRKKKSLTFYPSVAILVPAHNEEKVIAQTLDALIKLEYSGDLDIFLLNDNSADRTGEIVETYAEIYQNVHHIRVPEGVPKGKARVLNHGLSLTQADYVAVYDADNQPEPAALERLVQTAETTDGAVGAVGYVKTINEHRNWLTKMVALEFSVFQLVMQAGRWQLFKLGSLTGTNMLVSREALIEAGGWDPYALAEDADLTMVLTANGGLLPIVAESRTWEQEPETLKVWIRQRTRWMQGNLYIIGKTFRMPSWRRGRNLLHTSQLLSIYIGFVALLFLSDAWFVLGFFGFREPESTPAPVLLLWFESWMIYVIQLVSAQIMDKKLKLIDIIMSCLMYFTYAQLWLYLLVRGVYFQLKLSKDEKQPVWDKTIRF
ncbi:MAG TPA: glycosyltransferase [Bacillales bacterium]